jgi:hypothetical protein
LAGAAYTIAWLAGLAVWPTNLGIDSSDAAVTSAYRTSAGQAVAQYLLVEGLAGLLLGVVITALARRTAARSAPRLRDMAITAGLSAAVISVAQAVVGLAIVVEARGGHVAAAGRAFDTADRLDGVKMLLIAVAAAAFAVTPWSTRRVPRWLTVLSYALAVSIAVSGVGYRLLTGSLGWTAYVSGPLLLVWVPAVGFWASRIRRVRASNGMTPAAPASAPAAQASRVA